MTDRELMQMALDTLEYVIQSVGGNAPESFDVWFQKTQVPAEALRARLAQPEPEPLAWWQPNEYKIEKSFSWHKKGGFIKPLYTAPPQREWQGLTDEEILEEYRQSYGDDGNLTDIYFAHAIEAKLKDKNEY